MGNKIDMTGHKYGRLAVISEIDAIKCRCRCDCGNEVCVRRAGLRSGKTASCGCLRVETTRANKTRHGLSHGPEWTAYLNAKNRCERAEDVRFHQYGGRGIKMLFATFEDFFAEIGPRPDGFSLNRIDNDGDYAPGNIEWADRSAQSSNKQNTVKVAAFGRELPLTDWCRRLGLRYRTVWARINVSGMPPEVALSGATADKLREFLA